MNYNGSERIKRIHSKLLKSGGGRARMKDEGGRMKEKQNGQRRAFILHPSAFILALQGPNLKTYSLELMKPLIIVRKSPVWFIVLIHVV